MPLAFKEVVLRHSLFKLQWSCFSKDSTKLYGTYCLHRQVGLEVEENARASHSCRSGPAPRAPVRCRGPWRGWRRGPSTGPWCLGQGYGGQRRGGEAIQGSEGGGQPSLPGIGTGRALRIVASSMDSICSVDSTPLLDFLLS